MVNEWDLQSIIYSTLKTQIEFGIYRFGECLPAMEDLSDLLFISIDTARLAYRRLGKDGYISLSKNVGSVVKVDFRKEDIEQNVQDYFSERKDALLDLCHSMPFLFGSLQLYAWKNASAQALDKLEGLTLPDRILPSYKLMHYLPLLYGSLENNLLMRLICRICLLTIAPLLSLEDFREYHFFEESAFLRQLTFCRDKNWTALRTASRENMASFSRAVELFFTSRITAADPTLQRRFTWNSYKKSSQLCYSLGMELMTAISRGIYPPGSFLPSLVRLAEEKQVSISTVRRTLSLLNSLGRTKSVNGIGTQVLPMEEIEGNCDFSNPAVQGRLLDFFQSLQICAFSCRDTAEATVMALDPSSCRQWIDSLLCFKKAGRPDLLSSYCIEFISLFAPYQGVRTVYAELFKQLIWGYPLRLRLDQQVSANRYYLPYLDSMVQSLECCDASGFAEKLEEVLLHQTNAIAALLAEAGIKARPAC